MTRITIIVEGPTEESFVKNVLAPYFWPNTIYLTPFVLGVPGHKGGNVNYARVKKDILLQLKQDRSAYCSTMLDLYGLGAGFPGMHPRSDSMHGLERAARIEQSMRNDIAAEVPELRPTLRFVPYLQVHEFEGLLFSDPGALANALGRNELSRKLKDIRDAFATPEDINDKPDTVPSKRILDAYPPYQKVIEGTLGAQVIGIESMIRECAHFRDWIDRLSALAFAPRS